jgi:carbon storage regulator
VIVIPRKKGQRVVIDDEIILTVIEVRRDYVRLAVELPEGVSVQKPGVYEAILGAMQTHSSN